MSDPRPIEEIYAELAAHPDFVVGGYLSRQHLAEEGIEAEELDHDGIFDGMNAAANEELWSIVRESAS